MPNLDQTGPNGQGPNTGQGRGSCQKEVGGNNQGRMSRCCQRGMGRNKFCQNMNGGNIVLTLDEQEEILKNRLKVVQDEKNNLNISE